MREVIISAELDDILRDHLDQVARYKPIDDDEPTKLKIGKRIN